MSVKNIALAEPKGCLPESGTGMRNFFILLLFAGCVANVSAQGKIRLSGVIFEKSRSPVGQALVSIEKTAQKTYSDANGYYSLELAGGNYTVVVSALGYETQKRDIDLSGEGVNADFRLEPVSFSLNEIVVTGTGTPHYFKDAPVQTEVISGAALNEYAGRDIEEVIGGLSAGLTFNPNDMGSNVQLNGLKNDYILILIDGKRINGDVGGQNDLSRINFHNIERIEIVKGASSSLYGSDAIGGVINFISKRNTDKWSAANTTRIGAYGDLNQSNRIGFIRGKWNSTTSFSGRRTDGWKNTDLEYHRGKLVENSVTRTVNRSTNYTVSENLTYQLSKSFKWTADASFYEKHTYRPTGIPQWRFYDFYYRDQHYATGGRYEMKNKNYLSLDVDYDKNDYFYDYTSRDYTDHFDENGKRIVYYPGDRALQTSQRRRMGNMKGVFHLGEQHTLSSGVEYLHEKLVAPYRLKNNEASAYTLSVYIQEEWNPTEKINITGGMRLAEHKAFGKSLTPKISGLYKINDFSLRATYANGFKTPTVKELYYHYHATIMSKLKAYYGNERLKPQQSDYYAIGAEYNTPRIQASLTAYHNRIGNIISLQHTETSYEDRQLLVEETMRYVNLSKGRIYGLDVSFHVNLPHQIEAGGTYSYLNAKEQRTDDEEAEDYMKYVHINGTAHHNVTFQSSWRHAWKKYTMGISIYGRYQSERYYTSDGNAKPYQLWRINSVHSFFDKKRFPVDVHVGIDNLFNYVDRTPFGHNRGTTSPGRTLYASVTIKFQHSDK